MKKNNDKINNNHIMLVAATWRRYGRRIECGNMY
jgi:hypothetical protein